MTDTVKGQYKFEIWMYESFEVIVIRLYILINSLGNFFFDFIHHYFYLGIFNISYDKFYDELSENAKKLIKEKHYVKKLLQLLLKDLSVCKELSYKGWKQLKGEIQRALENKAMIEQAIDDDPSILNLQIKDPVFIVTLPRTGSTFLHTLLGKDKRFKVPELWEMVKTIPFPKDPYSKENRDFIKIYHKKLKLNKMISNKVGLESSHDVKPTDPEGFLPFLKAEGIYGIISVILNLPEYTAYIKNLSFETHLEIYKSLERNYKVIGKYQNIENRRYLLNQHFGPSVNIPALFKVFPDAKIITIHRDLKKIVPSLSSLYSYVAVKFRKPNKNTPQEICDKLTDSYLNVLDKIVEVRRKFSQDKNFSNRFIDISFRDLHENAELVTRRIYEKIDLEYTRECQEEFALYIYKQSEKKNKKHQYVKLTLNEDVIEKKSLAYRKEFNLNE